jgi:hypothetical protein
MEMDQTNRESSRKNKVATVILNKIMSGIDPKIGESTEVSETNGLSLYNIGKNYSLQFL